MYTSLESVLNPNEVETSGIDWHMHVVDFGSPVLYLGDNEARKLFKAVFDVRSFLQWGKVLCWYDCLRNIGPIESKQCLEGWHLIGCFYRDCSGGIDIASHFFVRRLELYRAGLEKWKDDIVFPSGTQKYSVFAVPPKGYVMPREVELNPHNHAVSVISWEHVEEMGINLTTLIDTISDEEFVCAKPKKPMV